MYIIYRSPCYFAVPPAAICGSKSSSQIVLVVKVGSLSNHCNLTLVRALPVVAAAAVLRITWRRDRAVNKTARRVRHRSRRHRRRHRRARALYTARVLQLTLLVKSDSWRSRPCRVVIRRTRNNSRLSDPAEASSSYICYGVCVCV